MTLYQCFIIILIFLCLTVIDPYICVLQVIIYLYVYIYIYIYMEGEKYYIIWVESRKEGRFLIIDEKYYGF